MSFLFKLLFRKKIKEYENRIAELKVAGWHAVSGWYNAHNEHPQQEYFDWERSYRILSKDKPIDGPKPEFSSFMKKDPKQNGERNES